MALTTTHDHDNAEANDPSNVTNPEHGSHHIVTPLQYTMVFGALLILTAVTAGVAFIDLHWANPVIAVFIACLKATIVGLFFMHAKYQSRLIKLTICSGLFMFLSLIIMTLSDYISRSWGLW